MGWGSRRAETRCHRFVERRDYPGGLIAPDRWTSDVHGRPDYRYWGDGAGFKSLRTTWYDVGLPNQFAWSGSGGYDVTQTPGYTSAFQVNSIQDASTNSFATNVVPLNRATTSRARPFSGSAWSSKATHIPVSTKAAFTLYPP